MRTQRLPGPLESWIGIGLLTSAGAGLLIALSGALTGGLPVAVSGGALAGVSVTALLAAGWIDGPALVVLAAPLPALYASDSMRIATVAPLTVAVIGGWLLSRTLSGRPVRTGTLPIGWIVLLFGVFVLTTITAQHRLISLREVLNLAVLLSFVAVSTDAFAGDHRPVRRVVRLLVVAGAVCGALAVLEMVGVVPGAYPRYDTPFNRAALGFGQPNGLGLFLAVVVPFAVYEWVVARDAAARAIAGLAFVLVAAGLTATFSRGSWLAVFAGAGALLFTGNARTVIRVWIGFAVVAVLADVVTGGAMRDTIERTVGDWVIEQRAALMLAGIAMFAAYPLTGVGPGGYAVSLDQFGPQIPQLWDYLPTPHNAYVQVAAETGAAGLLVFIAFLLVTIRCQIRRTRATAKGPGTGGRYPWREGVTARKERGSGPAAHQIRDAQLQRAFDRALLWSFATACAAGFVVWPLAHGTGQVVMLLAAAIHAARSPVPGAENARGPAANEAGGTSLRLAHPARA